jgi:hypothetical protein
MTKRATSVDHRPKTRTGIGDGYEMRMRITTVAVPRPSDQRSEMLIDSKMLT